MKLHTPDAVAALEAGNFARRTLVWVEMPAEDVGFWDDAYDAVIDERTYLATYGGMQIVPLATAADLGVRNLTITLSGLDARVAAEVLSQPYSQRPIYVSRALIVPHTQQLVDVTQWFAGFIDTIRQREKLGGTSVLEVSCEGIGRELGRSGARTRSDSDQRQLDADDGFFKHAVAASNVPLQWGRVESQPVKPPKQGGFAGWIDHVF